MVFNIEKTNHKSYIFRGTIAVLTFGLIILLYINFTITKPNVTDSSGIQYVGNDVTIPLQKSQTLKLNKTLILPESIACYDLKEESLVDISDVNPQRGKSIFFQETSCNSYNSGKIVIRTRQACAIESAALANPNFDVYVLFTSPGVMKYEDTISDKLLQALASYKNIKIHHMNYKRYVENTPLEVFYRNNLLQSSKYPIIHAGDALRYLTMWKYGGIYLDGDVVVTKSLEDLPLGYAGLESDQFINNAVLSFNGTGQGHHIAELCLEELVNNYRGNEWGYNGPGVITRVLQRHCGVKVAKEMLTSKCEGFRVYPREAFYPVQYQKWKFYFEAKYNKKIFDVIKNSYLVHVWNNLSKDQTISVKHDVPYSLLAKKYCPKVFSECGDAF